MSAFFIGIRVKGGIPIFTDSIDFTNARKKFFDWLSTDQQIPKNAIVTKLLQENKIDLKIEYKSRDSLPSEVKPKSE